MVLKEQEEIDKANEKGHKRKASLSYECLVGEKLSLISRRCQSCYEIISSGYFEKEETSIQIDQDVSLPSIKVIDDHKKYIFRQCPPFLRKAPTRNRTEEIKARSQFFEGTGEKINNIPKSLNVNVGITSSRSHCLSMLGKPVKDIGEKDITLSIAKSFIESSGHVAFSGNLGAVDPKQLAKKLFNLENIKKDQVSMVLCRKDPYHNEACKEYMNLFKFEGLRIDQALRILMEKIPLIGETHSIERMLGNFTFKYWTDNSQNVEYSEACAHIILCSLLILNSDLYSKTKMRKMTLEAYIDNVLTACTNDPKLPSQQTLKKLYNSIKKRPLPFHKPEKTKTQSSPQVNFPLAKINENPKEDYPITKTGPLYRKEANSDRFSLAPHIFSSWKLSFVTLKGLKLIFQKKEISLDKNDLVLEIHHSFAGVYTKSQGSKHVFYIRLANSKVYLLRDAVASGMLDWISHINTASGVLSTPILPISVGNPPFFSKAINLPSEPYKGSLCNLYKTIKTREEQLFKVLEQNLNYIPKPDEIKLHADSIAAIKEEIDRHGRYKMILLHSKVDFLKKFFLPSQQEKVEEFVKISFVKNPSSSQVDLLF